MTTPRRSGRPSSIDTIGLTGAPAAAAAVTPAIVAPDVPVEQPASPIASQVAIEPASPIDDDQQTGQAPGRDPLPPPPAARRREDRVQLNTKIRLQIRQDLDAFVATHGSTVQGVIEAALAEYMASRGPLEH